MAAIVDILAPLEQEGTRAAVRNWLKKIGDPITEGEPLVELETDKVTQEVSSPSSGVLTEILMTDGDDAGPGSILGRIEMVDLSGKAAVAVMAAPVAGPSVGAVHYSPAVRRAAEEYAIDPARVVGTGKGGRVTRADMDRAFEMKSSVQMDREAPASVASAPSAPPAAAAAGASINIPHSSMRLAIARHMAHSLATAPQVTAVFEADFTAISRHREAHKGRMKAEGVNLTYTAYLIAASAAAMKAVPEVNSQWHDDRLELFRDVNIGIGTALGDKGLVVPVIHQVQNLSLQGVAARLQDLTGRTKANNLRPEDMKGGTFTISNHGVSGSLFAAPIIINQPQSAILGVGKLEKRVVVRSVGGVDAIQIRPMAYVSLTIDHRSLDGHQTNAWLTEFVRTLEEWPE